MGAIVGAVKATGSRMRDQHVVMLGVGSAGIGVADMIRAQLVADGLSETDARRRFFIVDLVGLLTDARADLTPEQRVYAQPCGPSRAGASAPTARPGSPR